MVVEKSRTNVYLDNTLKEQAKEIYKHYGLSLSEAVNIFLAQSVFNRGLPFEVKLPNAETLEAMKDVTTGENYEDITLEALAK
jgi:DNA-damage-inducible protein J